ISGSTAVVRCRSASSTRAPRASSARAADSPANRTPQTRTVRPKGSSGESAMSDELGVEQPGAERDGQSGDDPEAHDDRDLLPTGQLAMVMDRRHLEYPLPGPCAPAGVLEPARLDDARERHDGEQPTQDNQQQLCPRQNGYAGHQAAQGHRAGVAHENLRRGSVPPQETEAGAHGRGGHESEGNRIPREVAAGERHRAAAVPELDERDERVSAEHHRAGAGREAVEPIGQVHRVRRRRDDEIRQDDEPNRPEADRADVPHVGKVGRRRPESPRVGVLQSENREYHSHDELPGEFRPGPQTQVALPADLDEVVDETDSTAAHHEEKQQQPRGRRAAFPQDRRHPVGDDVSEQGRGDDRYAAHGRCPALDQMAGWPVVADLLPEATQPEVPDDDGSEQDGEQQSGDGGEQDSFHSWPVLLSGRSPESTAAAEASPSAIAIRSRLAARDAFTSTTSPGRSSCCSSVSAASESATHVDSPSQEPSRAAPWAIGRAAAPTAISRDMSSRTASRPIASCSSAASAPSSAISPSTARVRAGRDRPIAARVFNAARTDSGLAL